MSLENQKENNTRIRELIQRKETPEERRKNILRTAQRNIKHAYWDFQARGGEDGISGLNKSAVDIFFESAEYKNMESNHVSFFKGDIGMGEAKQYIRDYIKKNNPVEEGSNKPEAGLDKTIPKESSAQDERFSVNPGNNTQSEVSDNLTTLTLPVTPTSNELTIPQVGVVKPLFTVAANDSQFSVVKTAANDTTFTQEAKIFSFPTKAETPFVPEAKTVTPEEAVSSITTGESAPVPKETNEGVVINTPFESSQVTEALPLEPSAASAVETVKVPQPEVKEEPVIQQEEPIEQPVAIPENTLENQENTLEYINGVKNLTRAYKTFLDRLSEYNETTLNRNGSESSESIIYNDDLEAMKNSVDVSEEIESKENAEEAFSRIQKARELLMYNPFPIKGGMSISSLDGYNILRDSLSELGSSISSVFRSLKNPKEQEELIHLLRLLADDSEWLFDIQNRKRGHLENYLSR